jgi:hypothetical protein
MVNRLIASAFAWNNYHIEECVDFRSKATPESLPRIHDRLNETKNAFRASKDATWNTPFYQIANRLAHLYDLAGINRKDAYIIFLHFANAPDVNAPVSQEAWNGAMRLYRKCLGLTDSKLMRRVKDLTVDINELVHKQSS